MDNDLSRYVNGNCRYSPVGDKSGVGVAWLTKATAGATGNATVTLSGYTQSYNPTVLLALKTAPYIAASLITSFSAPVSAFKGCLSQPTNPQGIGINGYSLTSDLIVTPPSGFEISTSSNSGFSSSPITLPRSAGSVSQTIYVRMGSLGVGSYSGNITCASSGVATQYIALSGTVTGICPDIALANNGSQPSASNMVKGSTNNILYTFSTAVTSANTTINQIDFTTTGNAVTTTDLTNIKLWYNTSNLFSSASLLSTLSTSLSAGSKAFTSLTQNISAATTGYFWITADIPAGATTSNTIAVSAISTDNLWFSNGGILSGTASAGNTQTIVAQTIWYSRDATFDAKDYTKWWNTSNGGGGSNPASNAVFTTAGNVFVIQSGDTAKPLGTWTGNSGSFIQVASGGVLDLNANTLSSWGSIKIAGNGAITSSNATASTCSIPIELTAPASIIAASGAITLSGPINTSSFAFTTTCTNAIELSGSIYGTGSVVKAGAGTLTFNGSANLALNDLSITGGRIIGSKDITVNGVLHLGGPNASSTVGILDMTGTYTLTMGASATTTGTGDVTGIITRNNPADATAYTFGNQFTSLYFTPGGTLPTSVSVKVVLTPDHTWKSNAIHRYYSIVQTGGSSSTKVSVKLHYLDSELNGVQENSSIDIFDYHGSAILHDHGHSLENSTDNWIELSGLPLTYIAPYSTYSDAYKYYTLGQSTTPNFTWIGAISTDWNEAANWSGGVPLATSDVTIPDVTTTTYSPTLPSSATINSMSIAAHGVLNGGTGTLTLAATSGSAWMIDTSGTNPATFNPGTSTVVFSGSTSTISGATSFYNLSVANNATLTSISNTDLHIAGSLNLNTNGTIDLTTYHNEVNYNGSSDQTVTYTTYHDLTFSGSGTKTLPDSLNVQGNWINGSTVIAGTTVTFSGSGSLADQTIGGSNATTFNNLVLSGSGTKTFAIATPITGNLSIASGVVANLGTYIHTAGSLTLNGASQTTSSSYGGTGSPAATVNSTYFAAATGVVNVGTCGTYSLTSTAATACLGSGATVTLTNTTTANLPTETYTVFYTLSGTNTGSSSATMIVTTAGTGTFTTTAIANSGATSISIDYITTGCVSSISANNTATITVSPVSVGGSIAGSATVCTGTNSTPLELSSFTGTITKWESSLDNFATAGTEITNSTSLLTAEDLTATTYYRAVITSGSCAAANSATATVTVSPLSVGGTATPASGSISSGTSTSVSVTGYNGDIQWQQSGDNSSWSNVSGGSGATTATYTTPNLTGTTYYRAVVTSGVCSSENSSTATITVNTSCTNNNWLGTSADWGLDANWSCGVKPTDQHNVFILSGTLHSPIISGDAAALTLTVNSGAVLTVNAPYTLTITDAVTVATGGTLTFDNNASLVQINSVSNYGNITYNRTSPLTVNTTDYVYWSSPVNGQTVPSGYNYYWNNAAGTTGNWAAASGQAMESGKGFIMRGVATKNYIGVPYNGDISVNVYRRAIAGYNDNWNLVGNPYPSAISVDEFLADSDNSAIEGSLALWTHGSAISSSNSSPFYGTFVYNYSPDDYIIYNSFASQSGPSSFNGNIAAGQAFFVKYDDDDNGAPGIASSMIKFKNSMRTNASGNSYGNSQFYRPAQSVQSIEKHRIWLDFISGTTAATNRIVVGYADIATAGKDRLFDAATAVTPSSALMYSLIGIDKMSIQAKGLPFTDQETIPMGYNAPQAGSFTIAIHAVDGLFGTQNIYLEDTELNVIHDIKQAAYTFTATQGENNTRFILRFTNQTLGNGHFDFSNSVQAITNDKVTVYAGVEPIQSIEVIDLLGRAIHQYDQINATTYTLGNLFKNDKVLFLKIKLSNKVVVTKKIIF